MTTLTPQDEARLRSQVRYALENTPAFGQLDEARRNRMASDMVRVLGYLSDPAAGDDSLRDLGPQIQALGVEALAEDGKKSAPRPPQPQQPRDRGVRGTAIKKGTDAFEDLVGAVDFPKFVSGLIDGVFGSIVESSIQQMEAYGDLLASVVKSVDEFANENFTDNNARDYLRNQFPGTFELETGGDSPQLRVPSSVDTDNLPDVQGFLGLEQGFDPTDRESEAQMVRAAKLKMARSRQQQLATMVVLGINRIVVTDGRINAKVKFDVSMSETSDFEASASAFDRETHKDTEVKTKRNFWGTRKSRNTNVNTRVQTSRSTASQESTEEVNAKAKLMGEVQVNFKSETFPLERLASADQLLTVQSMTPEG